ncbi:acyl-coenzyme A thioesterase 13 isoform X1 [Momordica charantia]|uniref:Acyl-coenzyme A thioesterase 13 n=1 Tax=Momordica charantia TaxID=3673 RepID=A0A6J1D5C3_MOMCH|nr:acyl-coenzyme A thioesterase 13 isoform X1 [Momordica charantia]
MEKTKQLLELTKEESDAVEKLAVRPRKAGEKCFFTFFALRGIRVDRVHPGLVVCTFKVPPRLTDRSGKLASGAIANLVDEVGSSVIYDEALPEPVSVDMSISYLSTAAVGDELEIISKLLGQKGRYSGTSVLIKNKTTGEIVAEGRHSLFSIRASKSKL